MQTHREATDTLISEQTLCSTPRPIPTDAHRRLLDALPVAAFLKDRDLRLIAVNEAFCAALGRCQEEVLGCDDFALYPAPDAERYRDDERRVLAEGMSAHGTEDRLIGGSARRVQVVRSPLRGARESVEGVAGLFWDITQERRREDQRRQAERLEVTARLAGGIAHDFNNLLSGVLGNVALVRGELNAAGPAAGRMIDLLERAEYVGHRAAELVRQLLGFARRLEVRPERLDLNGVVQEAVRAARPGLGAAVTVTLLLEPDLWPVLADPALVQRAVAGLCLGACDAMPRGGRLSLETANVPLSDLTAQEHLEGRPGDFVRVRVRDSGTALRTDSLPHRFEPFFPTKEGARGAGLGLAMAFGIVADHHGWITCRSHAGGNAFEVYLPRLVDSLV